MSRLLTTAHRWSPTVFDDLRTEMNRLMEGFFDGDDESRYFSPLANFAETEKSYEVTVDLPGMTPEEFHVEFKDGHLWITGQRKHESEEEGKTFHRVERICGRFRRVVALGKDANADQIEATYKDGVLAVHVPKVEAMQPKRIEVQS